MDRLNGSTLISDYFRLTAQRKKLLREVKFVEEQLRNLRKELKELDRSIMDQNDKILSGKREERYGR
jgi:septal ring factor EnvC (AmiA/AmiB activator)